MICPNCKSHIENNIKYCNYCGTKITNLGQNMQFNNHSDQYTYSETYSNITQTKVESEEDYLRAYMGPYYKFRGKEHFSIATLFFGPFHFLYKRMYIVGILLTGILGLIYFYQREMGFLLNIILNLFLSFRFQSMYDEFSTKKIDEIKISNPDKTSTELLEICKKKGKPLTILFIFFFMGLIALFSIIPSLIIQNILSQVEDDEIQELTYQIPIGFEEGSYNNNKSYKYYYYQENGDYCSIHIHVNDSTNLEGYAEAYFGEKVDFMDTEIHGWDWKNVTINKEEEEEDNYFIIVLDHLYHISYKTMNNSSCIQYKEEFVSSLDFPSIDQ